MVQELTTLLKVTNESSLLLPLSTTNEGQMPIIQPISFRTVLIVVGLHVLALTTWAIAAVVCLS